MHTTVNYLHILKLFIADQQSASKSNHNITWTPEVVADLIGARKEARRRKRVWEEWAIREYGGVGIAYNNPNVTFSKVDDMFKGKYTFFVGYLIGIAKA